MEIIAKSKYIRTSPRKLRLVADSLKDLTPQMALITLAQMGKRAAGPLRKAIKSALSNATHNFGLSQESLKIKKIEVGEGPIYKRWRAAGRGYARPITKRTSHITLVLVTPEEGK